MYISVRVYEGREGKGQDFCKLISTFMYLYPNTLIKNEDMVIVIISKDDVCHKERARPDTFNEIYHVFIMRHDSCKVKASTAVK